MKTIKLFTIAAFLIAVVNISFAQESSSNTSAGMKFEAGTWSEVLTLAKEQNKPIFVDAYADWCGPCKWMMANVFPTEQAGNFYNENFVIYKLDMEKGEGPEFAEKYGVMSYPTYIYFNADGQPVHRSGGSKPTEEFIEDGKNALNPDKQYYTLKAKYDNGDRTEATLYELSVASMKAYIDNPEVTSAYLESQIGDALLEEKNWELVQGALHNINSPVFNYVSANKEKFGAKYGMEEVNMRLGMAYIDYYMQKKDWNNYAKYTVKFVDENNPKDAAFYNSVAWSFYENVSDKKMLKKALGWAKKSMDIQLDYYNADTYASLLYKLGKYEEALTAADDAIKVAKKENMDYKATEKLKEMINKKLDE